MALHNIADRKVRIYQPFKNAKNYIAYIDGFSLRFSVSTPMAAENKAWAKEEYFAATTPQQRREHTRKKAAEQKKDKPDAADNGPSGAPA